MENDLYNQEDPLAGIPTDVPNLLDGEPPPDTPETPTETPPATVTTEPTPDQVAAYLREHPELLPPPQIIQQPIQAPTQTVNPYEMREDETLEQFQTRAATQTRQDATREAVQQVTTIASMVAEIRQTEPDLPETAVQEIQAQLSAADLPQLQNLQKSGMHVVIAQGMARKMEKAGTLVARPRPAPEERTPVGNMPATKPAQTAAEKAGMARFVQSLGNGVELADLEAK